MPGGIRSAPPGLPPSRNPSRRPSVPTGSSSSASERGGGGGENAGRGGTHPTHARPAAEKDPPAPPEWPPRRELERERGRGGEHEPQRREAHLHEDERV